MAASCQTLYFHGASPTPGPDVTGSTVRFKLADNDTQDSNNPIPVPVSGEQLSYTKFMMVNFVTSPAGSISNLRFFVTSPPTGINHYSWVQSVYTQPSASDENGITGYTDTSGNKTTNNYPNRTSSNPLVVNSGTVLSNPNTGEGSQSYVQHQLGVLSTYPGGAGPITPFTGTFRYNETISDGFIDPEKGFV
jgi:hypothetical protein